MQPGKNADAQRSLPLGKPSPLIVTALCVMMLAIAVPLYLWRRPLGPEEEPRPLPRSELAFQRPAPRPTPIVPAADTSRETRVRLSEFTTIRCVKAGPHRTPPEKCEHIGDVESALEDALQRTFEHGPKTVTGATVSVVLDIDFRKRRLKVYRGKSSSVSRARTRELFGALRAAMPEPNWDTLPHRHFKYVVYVKATYPPVETF